MTAKNLVERIEGDDLTRLLPMHMDTDLLVELAGKLSKWRQGELTDDQERIDLEHFSQKWGDKVLPGQRPVLVAKMRQDDTYVLATLALMSGLEFLVQQEMVSRELSYKTYEMEDFSNLERLKAALPAYIRSFFRYNGLLPIVDSMEDTELSLNITKFLNECFGNKVANRESEVKT